MTSSRAGFPHLRLALHRLKLAGAEQPRPPLVRRCAGDVRHPFEPHPALRAEHLEAEARAGRGHRAEIARTCRPSSGTGSRWCRRRRSRRRAGSSGRRRDRSGRTDRSCRRSRARPSASARRTAFPRGCARHAVGFSISAFGNVIVASTCRIVPSSPRADAIAQPGHLGMEAPVVAEAERDAGVASPR